MKKHVNHSVLRWSALLLISVLILGTLLVSAFAAETAETRYTTDGGTTWTEATFKDALAAGVAAEKTTIELLGNYTLSQVFTVTGGDITIKSIDGQTYTVTKGTGSAGDIFTVSGGAKITLANIKFEGGGKWSSPLGSLFRLSTKDDTVILESGTTVNGFYVNGSGSVVNAPNGYVEMKDGVTITNCTAKYSGGAFSIGVASGTGEGAVLNMTGGTISGCAVNNLSNGVHTGSAVAVFKNATFNMSGGLITNCESLRTSAASSHATGAIIDGAVGMKDGPHTVTISGDAVIRDNRAYRWNGTDKELSSGADVVHNRGYQNAAYLVIAKDFTGSIGAANAYSVATTAAETVAFATAGEGWNAGDIIHGVIDNNSNRVAKVAADGTLVWADAVAETDIDGKLARYTTLADAIEAIKNTDDKSGTIRILGNVTLTEMTTFEGVNVLLEGKDGVNYTLYKDSTVATALFTLTGGTTLTLKDITLDAKNKWLGTSVIALSTVNDKLVLDSGAVIQGNYSAGSGGAITAANGHVVMKKGSAILNCSAKYNGGAILLGGGTKAVFDMEGGLIKGCQATNNGGGTMQGSAVCMSGNATFNMSGGLITECSSGRTVVSGHLAGTLLDGAVTVRSGANTINISGDAIIRDNKAMRYDGTNKTLDYGGDIISQSAASFTIAKDFTGSIGYNYTYSAESTAAGSVAIATAGEGWNEGDIITGMVDANANRVAKVGSDGLIYWVDAVAETDLEGKVNRYLTFNDAYAAVEDTTPIKLLDDVIIGTKVINKVGESVDVILNGNTATFDDAITCGTPTVATKTIGAYTYGDYTYAGVSEEVSTYTATVVTHVHATTAVATANAPAVCDDCGMIMDFPTDTAVNVRYTVDGGETWVYSTFDAALTAVSGKTAVIEIFRDMTMTTGVAISEGNLTIRSLPADVNAVDTNKKYTVKKSSDLSVYMFASTGGTLSIENLIIDGNSKAIFSIKNAAAVVNVTDSIVQKAYSGGEGGAFYINAGTLNILRTTIQDCQALKGAGIFATSCTINLTDSVIIRCKTTTAATGHGGALAAYGSVTATFKDCLVTECASYRTNAYAQHGVGAVVDGAIALHGYNTVTISGNTIVRGNLGKRWDGTSVSTSPVAGGDIVFTWGGTHKGTALTIADDFTGSVGVATNLSVPTTEAGSMNIALVGSGYSKGTILGGVFDTNANRVAKVDGAYFVWADAEAELDIGGKITRYVKADEAYAVAGSTTPIKLLADGVITFKELGESAKIIENGFNFKASYTGGYRKTGTEEVTIGAYTFMGNTFAGQKATASIYTAIDGGSISSGRLVAGTDLSMTFYTYLGENYIDSILRVTRSGKSVDLEPTYDQALGQYYFVYKDIAPQCAGDVIKVELIHGEDVLDSREDFSILKYCQSILALSDEELGLTAEKAAELRILTRDLLEYCASAQVYTLYNTDALVNEGITASKFYPMATTPKKVVANNTVAGVAFAEAGLHFDNVNNLYFTFTTPDAASTKLVVNGKTYTSESFELVSGTTYILYTEDLYATQFDKIFTVQLYSDNTLVQTLTYSVAAYVYSMLESEDEVVRNLAMATYNYGVAARIYADKLTAKAYNMTELAKSGGFKALGGAAANGTALALDGSASGLEFNFRGNGDVVLNITATAAARLEVNVDSKRVEHLLISAGTADYTIAKALLDGKHTVSIVQENGAATVNSVSYKGYAVAPEKDSMFIEFVGGDILAGHTLFLNYESVEDDATGTYAVLAARELGARYLISTLDKNFTATDDIPDLVVIDYKEGTNYTAVVTKIRAAYGNDVKILFAAGAMDTPNASTLEALGTSVTLTTDTTGYDGYPSYGGSAIMGAELAKFIRENYDFFTAEEAAEAQKDIIVEVDGATKNGYNSFYVYIRTSDPSGKYYIRYNFIYEYSAIRDRFYANTGTNISNFRVLTATLVEVKSITATDVTCTEIKQVLQGGEISTAISIKSPTSSYKDSSGNTVQLTPDANGLHTSPDYIGGLHGDEQLSSVKLIVDGVEVSVKGSAAKVVTGNTVIFDQSTMMYEWATSTADSFGTPMTTHNQHFTITREAGFYNRQSYEWQKDITVATPFLQMFTLNHTWNGMEICPIVEAFDADGKQTGAKTNVYDIEESYYAFFHSSKNRRINYSSDISGVSATAFYDTCRIGTFDYNDVAPTDYCIHKRTQGDNKLYGSFNSNVGGAKVAKGEQWMVDVAYNIDYIAP